MAIQEFKDFKPDDCLTEKIKEFIQKWLPEEIASMNFKDAQENKV
jgi:hypothetical protein